MTEDFKFDTHVFMHILREYRPKNFKIIVYDMQHTPFQKENRHSFELDLRGHETIWHDTSWDV